MSLLAALLLNDHGPVVTSPEGGLTGVQPQPCLCTSSRDTNNISQSAGAGICFWKSTFPVDAGGNWICAAAKVAKTKSSDLTSGTSSSVCLEHPCREWTKEIEKSIGYPRMHHPSECTLKWNGSL